VHANESDCNAVATTYTSIKFPAGTLFFLHTNLLLPLYYFAYIPQLNGERIKFSEVLEYESRCKLKFLSTPVSFYIV